jgi:transposase-like protein
MRMSRKERDRLKVVEQIVQGQLSQSEGARLSGINVRQMRRIERRYRDHGDAGLAHQGRGKPSNRRIDAAVEGRCKGLLQTRYRG